MGKKTRASKKKLDKLLENCAMIRRKEKLKNVKKEIQSEIGFYQDYEKNVFSIQFTQGKRYLY